MLPKVATHLLHSTSRAAATIHHQSATIRNVLQLQTSSAPPSSTHLVSWSTTPGSSNWGGSSSSSGGGTSSGSAKYGTGSRFYYNGAGRAVTQANTTTTNDGTFHQSDETEEPPVKRPASTSAPRKSRRLRSNSLSIPSQDRSDRGEKLGVLRTVQLHARSKQTFAPNSSIHPQQSIDLDASEDATPTRPVHVRRNSTSSPPLPEPATLPNPSRPPTPVRHNSTLATSHQAEEDIPPPLVALDSAPVEPPPASLKSADALIVDDVKALNNAPADTPEIKFLKKAMTSDGMNPDEVSVAARAFRASRDPASVSDFNVALSALMKHRRPGDPLHEVLETYNEMLRRQITPTGWTYAELINAFTTRDHEVERVISALEWKCATADKHGRDCSAERKRLETLRKEDNFTSALSVFEALVHMEVTTSSLSSSQFTNLLRSCASRGALESAKHIYQHHVTAGLKPSAYSCNYLMQTHINAGDLMGARKWFDQFNSERAAGKLYDLKEPAAVHRSVLQVWNTMIEAYFRFNQPEMAVGILEEMMDVTVDSATLQTAPPVATSTFAVLLAGFIRSGDVKTALSWFRRLLDQPNAPSQDPYHPIGFATSPDATAWSLMIDCLGEHRMVQELNELFTKRRPSNFTQDELQVIAFANIASLADLTPLDLLPAVQHVMTSILPRLAPSKHAWCIQRLTETCAARGMYEDALNIFMPFARALLASAKTQTAPQVMTVQSMQLSLSQKLYEATKGNIPFSVPLQLARLAADARIIQPAEHTLFFLHSYALSQQNLPADMGIRDWELLLYAAVEAEAVTRDGAPVTTVPGYAFEGLSSLLRDLVETKVSMDSMDPDLLQRIAELVARTRSILALEGRIAHLSPSFHAMLTSTELPDSSADGKSDSGYSSGSAGSEPAPKLKVDVALSKAMNAELRKTTPTNGVTSAYELFLKGLQDRLAPNPAVLGLMIQNLGRINKIEEVSHAYNVAQQVLQSLEQMKSWQKDSWFTIEDSMVIALAHHGNVDGAHMHRLRILDYGRAPSADAYGALIYNVRDTTDDASNALALFQEAQQLGVHANGYLYNNIISKLARARKADHALELFQQMKATSIPPTSVTYGAVIGACARVGDVASAEALFSEMVVSKNFKPRVPPYNTMIQMYTTTKPNRELALHYYDQLLQAKIKPTAYTYKLLMDAYGSIEPVNIRSMEEVFKKIQNDPEIVVQGNHYSSMINAYGCVQKNLDKAIEVFDSIPTSMTSRIADAVVFEAMINALVANRRTDLIPQYIEKMKAVGVHMTAYIANFLIKGYALAGDMDQARQTFESLEDPPEGIAAPNNHAPHDPSELPAVDVTAPVYREPSTWEAMVRAELGSGNREGALDLLERLRTRQYPEAVFNRISGIMVDHSSVFP